MLRAYRAPGLPLAEPDSLLYRGRGRSQVLDHPRRHQGPGSGWRYPHRFGICLFFFDVRLARARVRESAFCLQSLLFATAGTPPDFENKFICAEVMAFDDFKVTMAMGGVREQAPLACAGGMDRRLLYARKGLRSGHTTKHAPLLPFYIAGAGAWQRERVQGCRQVPPAGQELRGSGRLDHFLQAQLRQVWRGWRGAQTGGHSLFPGVRHRSSLFGRGKGIRVKPLPLTTQKKKKCCAQM